MHETTLVHRVFSANVKAKPSRFSFGATSVSSWASVMVCLFAAMHGLKQAPSAPGLACFITAKSSFESKASLPLWRSQEWEWPRKPVWFSLCRLPGWIYTSSFQRGVGGSQWDQGKGLGPSRRLMSKLTLCWGNKVPIREAQYREEPKLLAVWGRWPQKDLDFNLGLMGGTSLT